MLPLPQQWTIDRFLRRLDQSAGPSGCWLWLGAKRLGYGRFVVQHQRKRKWLTAHRVAWQLFNSPIPDGIDVLHACDNPACCNPAHLFLGNHSQNMRDREAKGRHNAPRGSKHGRATLTEDDVRQIRALHAAGVPQNRIAAMLGTNTQRVYSIVHRQTWRHVE